MLAVLIGAVIAKIVKKYVLKFETMQEALDNPIKWLPAAAYFKEEMGDINDIIEEQEKKEK